MLAPKWLRAVYLSIQWLGWNLCHVTRWSSLKFSEKGQHRLGGGLGNPIMTATEHAEEGESNGSASIPSAFYVLLRITEISELEGIDEVTQKHPTNPSSPNRPSTWALVGHFQCKAVCSVVGKLIVPHTCLKSTQQTFRKCLVFPRISKCHIWYPALTPHLSSCWQTSLISHGTLSCWCWMWLQNSQQNAPESHHWSVYIGKRNQLIFQLSSWSSSSVKNHFPVTPTHCS